MSTTGILHLESSSFSFADISPSSSVSSPRFNNGEDLGPLLSGKTIAQVNATKKSVGNLVDYWKVKGLFLSNKTYPHTRQYDESFAVIADYLDKYTMLKFQPFWTKMLKEDKEELCKYIGMIDTKPLQLMINANVFTAELCIIFNGLPYVIEGDSKDAVERSMKQGQLVGPLDLFNDPTVYVGYKTISQSIQSEKGCVLRLPFQAYYKQVYLKRLPPKKVIIPVNFVNEDHLEDETRATMSSEDHQVFNLRILARGLIPKRVFRLMLANDLIGSRFGDKGSGYVNSLDYGRQIQLSNTELHSTGLGCVYIVLKGSLQLRLSACQRTASEKKKTILVAKSAINNRLEIKANDVPVVQVEAGTWVTINKEVLNVGQHEIKYPPRPNSHRVAVQLAVATIDEATLPDRCTSIKGSDKGANGAIGDTIKPREKKIVSREAGSKRLHLQQALLAAADLERQKMDARKIENGRLAYRLYFKVSQECTYVAIPYATFVKVLKDCKSTETIRQMEQCLSSSKDAILTRLHELLPIINDYIPVAGTEIASNTSSYLQSLVDEDDTVIKKSLNSLHISSQYSGYPKQRMGDDVDVLQSKYHEYVHKEADVALDDPQNTMGLCGTFMEPDQEQDYPPELSIYPLPGQFSFGEYSSTSNEEQHEGYHQYQEMPPAAAETDNWPSTADSFN